MDNNNNIPLYIFDRPLSIFTYTTRTQTAMDENLREKLRQRVKHP